MLYISFLGQECEELWNMYREGKFMDMNDFFKEHNGQLYKFNLPREYLRVPKQSHVIITTFNSVESCTESATYCKSLEAKCIFIFVNFSDLDCRVLLNTYGPAKYIYYDGLGNTTKNSDPLKLFELSITPENIYNAPQLPTAVSPVLAFERPRMATINATFSSKKNFSKLVVLDFLAKQHYEILPKPIKCPVCIEEIPYEKFVLLCCGHYHCKSCLERLDKCSVCRYTG